MVEMKRDQNERNQEEAGRESSEIVEQEVLSLFTEPNYSAVVKLGHLL